MTNEATKKCTKCGEVKPLSGYSPHARAPLGVQPRCKACCAAANSARYHANIDVMRERSRLRALEDQRKNPEARAAARKKWREANPEADLAAKKKWAEANHDKVSAAKEAWRLAHKEKWNEDGKAWKKANPAAMKKYRLRKYGLTVEQYDAMVIAQGGRCAICDTDTPAKHGQWCVDHDHDTKEVRGLLCVKCNAGLGSFDDSAAHLLSAERYLQSHRAPRLKAV